MGVRLAVLLACLLGGPLVLEGCMRFLLFNPGELAADWGRELRRPGLFADPLLDDEYWRLEWTLRETGDKLRSPPYDELLGWTNHHIAPETYEYLPAVELAGRRPVILYGASFADCVIGVDGCFGALLERSALGERFALLNYAVGGHGCGQTLTLLRATIDDLSAGDPLVVIALVSDSDFTRCSVEFRSWPKLRLVRKGGELVPEGPVPTGGPGPYMQAHGTGITSYAWRYLLHAPSQLPLRWQRALRRADAREAEQDALIEDIVLALRDELEARELDYFFLLLTSPRGLPPAPVPAEERLLLRVFEEQRIPFVNSRPFLARAAAELEGGHRSLFIQEGPQRRHPNLAGNEVLFEALASELERR